MLESHLGLKIETTLVLFFSCVLWCEVVVCEGVNDEGEEKKIHIIEERRLLLFQTNNKKFKSIITTA